MKLNRVAIALLFTLGACGGSGESDVGSDPSNNASGDKLTSPDLNRDPNTPRPMPDPNTLYPIAQFFDQVLREGAHYTLIGQFKSINSVSEQEHRISRAPMSRAPWPWRDKGDLLRTLVTVSRTGDGQPGKTDVYAGYFDINGDFLGQRIKGESAIELAQGAWVRPKDARVGEVGEIGRVATYPSADSEQTGYRDTGWEMLMLSDGSPAYCERTEEFDTADRSVWAFEWCRGITPGGKPTERITYSYEFGQNTGNIVGTNFGFGPAAVTPPEPADGEPFQPPAQTPPKLTELDCVYEDTGTAAVRTHQRRNFIVNAALGELQNGQGQLLANFFRWDAWQKAYVTWSRSDQALGEFEQFSRFDAQLNATLYQAKNTAQDDTYVSTDCYAGVVTRPRVTPDGTSSTLNCEREDLRNGAMSTGEVIVRMNNGWINTDFSRGIGVSPSERFDAMQFQESLPSSTTNKSFERLPDGWIHYQEQHSGRGDGGDWAREDHFEFNAAGNFRSYQRVVPGIERLSCNSGL